MRILAIGDFHGKFPAKLKKLTNEVDLVVCVGDYFSFTNRDLFFKYSYNLNVELWEAIGKKRVKAGILKDLKSGEDILRILNRIDAPVASVIGNLDYTHVHDVFDEVHDKHGNVWEWEDQDFFSPMIKKYNNIHRFDYNSVKLKGLTFIGAYGHTFPGKVRSKSYKKHRAILEKIFIRYKKENKGGNVIFVSHNMPYNCKLDKIKSKEAPDGVRGKHYGSKLIRRIIDKHQPVLAIGGHMHENQGKCKIGSTIVVNPGAAIDGKCAIIDFDEKMGRIKKIKFVN